MDIIEELQKCTVHVPLETEKDAWTNRGRFIFSHHTLLNRVDSFRKNKTQGIASSHDKSKLLVILGVAAFIAALNSFAFSLLSIIILDSIGLAKIIGNFGMFAAMVIVPLIPSWLVSTIILRNRSGSILPSCYHQQQVSILFCHVFTVCAVRVRGYEC